MTQSTATTTTATRRRKSSSKPKKPVTITKLRKNTFVADKDVHPNALTTKILGSLNPVTRTDLSDATQIKGGPTVYFKPGYTAKYAVASTRLARALDMETVISHNAFAHMNNEDGAVSGQVLGVPVRSVEHDTETHIPDEYNSNAKRGGDPTPEEIQNWLDSVGASVIQKDGKYFEVSGYVQNPIEYTDPRIQKGMSDLQIFDAITGQIDRHGGNIYIDPATGKVTGIDDDSSMKDLPWGVGRPYQKYPGLPPLVDRTTAQKVLALRPEDIPNILAAQRNDLGELSEMEIQAAEKRLRDVQAYLRTLQGTPGIVDTWDGGTFASLMAQPDKTYLGRAQTDLQGALTHQPIDGMPTRVGPPLVAPPPLPWTPVTPTVGQQNPSNLPTSPRLPTILGTRPRPGAQRLRAEQLGDQQLLDQIDNLPPLPAAPKKLGVSPNSPGRAALSRLASTQLRRAPEKKKEESAPQVDDSGESTSESDITVTPVENDQPTRSAQPIVSPSRPAEPTDIEKRVDALEALLHDLTGGSGNV